jgi:hypothetical protein
MSVRFYTSGDILFAAKVLTTVCLSSCKEVSFLRSEKIKFSELVVADPSTDKAKSIAEVSEDILSVSSPFPYLPAGA